MPAANRLGAEGDGYRIALSALAEGRISIAAACVGLARAGLEAAAAYLGERQAFGGPLSDQQGLRFMLAEMARDVAAARALTRVAAAAKDRGEPLAEVSSLAKWTASDTAMRVATDAVQLFGGTGYSRETGIERLMRDAKGAQIYEGTNQIHREIVAGEVLKRAAPADLTVCGRGARFCLDPSCHVAHPACTSTVPVTGARPAPLAAVGGRGRAGPRPSLSPRSDRACVRRDRRFTTRRIGAGFTPRCRPSTSAGTEGVDPATRPSQPAGDVATVGRQLRAKDGRVSDDRPPVRPAVRHDDPRRRSPTGSPAPVLGDRRGSDAAINAPSIR